MVGLASFDLRAFAERVDCERIIAGDLQHEPNAHGRFHCPWHDDRTPDLAVDRRTNRWRCWAGCGQGDVLDWTQRYHGLDNPIDAARRLGADIPERGDKGPRRSQDRSAVARPSILPSVPLRTHVGASKAVAWDDPEWQKVVNETIRDAEERLWSREGVEALAYLRWRGFRDHTIRHFALGYVDRQFTTKSLAILEDDRGPHGIFVPRSIVIPFIHPDAWFSASGPAPEGPRWVGANCRVLPESDWAWLDDPDEEERRRRGPKYRTFRGTERGHLYPYPTVEPTQGELPAILTEGEFDAITGNQEIGHLAHVRTIGGASSEAKPTVDEALARCPEWLIATDHDRAGVGAAWWWKDRGKGKATTARALLPLGKDLNKFHQVGGDVREWIKGEFERLGWAWPKDR